MKLLLTFFLLCGTYCSAQTVTISIPTSPITKGSAFAAQFIVEGGAVSSVKEFQVDGFDVISGPVYYRNAKNTNIVYTLVPSRSGDLKIGPASILTQDDKIVQSASANVRVQDPEPASFTSSTSTTDPDLYHIDSTANVEEIIRRNLFIRTEVSKRSVTIGEPVTVTYTLYSRLASTSEALRSPSFYGFSVVDMVPINESHIKVQRFGKNIFNTSVLRQVQLYPLRSGIFRLDAMVVANEIEFRDEATGAVRKVSKDLLTDSTEIIVNDLPAGDSSYTGAVGLFTLTANIKDTVNQNEQNVLRLTISGRGNFIQFSQPIVRWPAGIEEFESSIQDSLDKSVAPLSGSRTYSIPFVALRDGNITIPPISFVYYDPYRNSFDSSVTSPIVIHVRKGNGTRDSKTDIGGKGFRWYYLLALPLLILILIVVMRRKRHS